MNQPISSVTLHPIFKLNESASDKIIDLLDEAVLGTNGAQYRHLDTKEKIGECDDPLFLSMERNEKAIGNITFCRRGGHWYIRYFAFSTLVQSSGKQKSKASGEGFIKREINRFFDLAFQGEFDQPVQSFYAYIDPNNVKSLWMSENFGFEKIGTVVTQSFSRTHPKASSRLYKLDSWEEMKDSVSTRYKDYAYYFDVQTKKPPLYVLKDDSGKIIASTKISYASWEIKRFPGKLGGILVKLVPFVPILNKLIKPKQQNFLVMEAPVIENNDPKLFEELISGILNTEKKTVCFWWVDPRDELYRSTQQSVKWGLLHRLLGSPEAFVVRKTNPQITVSQETGSPIYTVGLDFI